MKAIELGNVVDLNVVLDTISKSYSQEKARCQLCRPLRHIKCPRVDKIVIEIVSHSMSRRTISVVVATHEIIRIVVLELLFKRKRVEFSSQGKLSVDLLLGDVEVLDVEEAHFGNGVVQLLDELLFAAGLVKFTQIESDQLSPFNCWT